MEKAFLFGSIVIFIFLGIFIWAIWKNPKQPSQYIKPIRASWYFVFVTGALVFINLYPESIFAQWERYLIVLVGFFLIDAFVFLNLYFSKFGGNELKEHPETEEAIAITQELLNQTKAKIDNLTGVREHEFVSYTGDEASYIQKFEELIQKYASLEDLIIDIIPYHIDDEKKEVEVGVIQKFKIRR